MDARNIQQELFYAYFYDSHPESRFILEADVVFGQDLNVVNKINVEVAVCDAVQTINCYPTVDNIILFQMIMLNLMK